MIDVRLSVIESSLKNIKKVFIVCGSKGGVGKSTVTYILSKIFSQNNKVGVWDLDFTGPSLHLMFNTNKTFTEENGIKPPEIDKNIYFLSIVFFSYDKALCLRGYEITDIILELLTITQWEGIDYLFIDTPPTITDTILDVIKFIPNSHFVIVSNNSFISYNTTFKLIDLIENFKKPIDALVINQNIYTKKSFSIDYFCEYLNNFYGNKIDLSKIMDRIILIPYIENIEGIYGNLGKLEISDYYKKIREEVLAKLEKNQS